MASEHSSTGLSDEEANRIAERYGPHVRVFPLEDANRVPGTKQVLFRGCSFNLKYSGKSRGAQQTFECTKRRSLGCTAQVLLFDDLDYALMKYGHNHGVSGGSKPTATHVQWSEGIVPRPVAPISKAKPSKPTARVRAALEKAAPVREVAWDKPLPQRSFVAPQQPTRNVVSERMEIASRLLSIVDSTSNQFVRTLQLLPELVVVCCTTAQLRALSLMQQENDILVLDVCTRTSRAHGEMMLNLALWQGQTDSVSLIATVILGQPGLHSYRVAVRELVRLCHVLASSPVQIVVPFLSQLHTAVKEAMPYASLHGRTDDLRACLASTLSSHVQTQAIVALMERLSESSCSPEMWTAHVKSLSESVDPAQFQQLCSTWLNSDATFPPAVWGMPTPRLSGSEAATRAFLQHLWGEIAVSDSVVETVEAIKRFEEMRPGSGHASLQSMGSPAQIPQHHQQQQSHLQLHQRAAQHGLVHHPFHPDGQQVRFSAPSFQAPSMRQATLQPALQGSSKMAVTATLQNANCTSPAMHMHTSLPMLARPEMLARRTHSLPSPGGQALPQKMFDGSVRLAPIHFPGEGSSES